MKRILLSSTPSVLVLIAMCGVPAIAAGQGARDRGTAQVEGRAVPRGEARPAQERPAQPRAVTPRAEGPQRSVTPRVAPPRAVAPPATAVPRTTPRVVTPPSDHPAYRPDYRPNYRPSYRPSYRPGYRPLHRPDYRSYYRPYYTFRPRGYLGVGLLVGYPVAYPYYLYPYSYSSPYPVSPYPVTVYPVPGATPSAIGAAGGLSFDIRPPEASVYIDGRYAGTVGQFSPNLPPLPLSPGRHHVEISEPGFETIAFDVDILPGQVIPYQGDLRQF